MKGLLYVCAGGWSDLLLSDLFLNSVLHFGVSLFVNVCHDAVFWSDRWPIASAAFSLCFFIVLSNNEDKV